MHEKSMSRRRFIGRTAGAIAGVSLTERISARSSGKLVWKEARYYKTLQNGRVQCLLCPWQCIVDPGRRGHCDVRANRDGVYYSLVYGRIASYHNDPIEKKPLFHFLPKHMALSMATAGCNVDCKFCQNWELAQRLPEDIPGYEFSPGEIIALAGRWGSHILAYTYNEPTVFTEYILDIAAAGKKTGLKSVVISNGYINRKPLLDLCRVLDAYKVDLKAFTESYYRDVVGGRLAPVLDTLVTLKSEGMWVEIVYLVVPTLNDQDEEVRKMAKWVGENLGPDVPVHFSRFYPKYKLKNLPPTPVNTLERVRQVVLDAGLHYVYLGNVPGHPGENTYCPSCGKTLIRRLGYQVFENHITNGQCGFCKSQVAGIWHE